MTYPEKSLPRRFLDGDPEVLGQAMRSISNVLTSPQFWSLRSEWADLFQEVLARLTESLKSGRYDADRDFHAYIRGVTRYTALQAVESIRRRRGVGQPEEVHWDVAAGDRVAGRQLVKRVLDELSEDCRALIRAYYLEEKRYEEIAAEFSIPEGTVKSRLSRCMECARRSIRMAIGRQPRDQRGRALAARNTREP